MTHFVGKVFSTPKVMLMAQLAALTVVFVAVLAAILADSLFSAGIAPYAGVVGALIYAALAIVLMRRGLAFVQNLEEITRIDSLTGLLNRRGFHCVHEQLKKANEASESAVALIDLDGFMVVNDHYGHVVGDQALKACASLMEEICEGEARVSRLGGDEFAILKVGPLSATLLEGICRKIMERLARPIHVDDRRLTLGASVGLARSDSEHDLDSSELLRRADVAMYASKRGGKARCTWFNPDFDSTREQVREMDDELRQGLARNEFTVHYQPLIDCQTSRIVAVESLIRWERPDGKMVGPNVFIPVAEESGLINPIGLFVLRRACLDALAWGDIKLSVNISAAQLRNPEFPIHLGQILEETGLDPDRLELEITETCLVLDPVVAERSLSLIRGFGVNVVLDDFGTGYASFGFLRQFRFEKLKIDRSLVVQAGEDDGSRAMMLSSITVARAMKMDVTAEGVETEEQARMVRAAGCDQIQGWLYFRAMPASEIAQYLDRPISIAPLTSDSPDHEKAKRVA